MSTLQPFVPTGIAVAGRPHAAEVLVSHFAPAPAAPPAAPAPTPFTFRVMLGLIGVLLAVLVSGFNEHVIEVELDDIQGAMGFSHDQGTWVTAIYEATEISAMAFAPWCGITFSIRRFAIAMIGLFAVLGAISPYAPDLPVLYVLRAVQGFAGGTLPPLLMTVALRYLPPKIKIHGLGAYTLTATFGPNMGTPLGAWCFEYLGWHSVFWEVIPFSLIAMAAIAYGLPQDPMRLERFRQFNWRGLLLGMPAICMIVIALMQGDRLDWFNSPVICQLLVGGVFLFGLFLVNEWYHPLPFFRIQMLGRRNISFALIAVALVLVLAAVDIAVPSAFLAMVWDYRPEQIAPVALVVAVPQLIVLPLVAAFCNFPRVDCRYVMAAGLVLMGLSFFAGTFITSDWYGATFYPLQVLMVFGEPMVIIPILMCTTLSITPPEAPFVSGMFNMVKGLASALAVGFIDIMMTWREHLHSQVLLDQYGNSGFTLDQFNVDYGGLGGFGAAVRAQAMVLTSADIYAVMLPVIGGLLLLTILIPKRVLPPSAQAKPATPGR
jgi:MFS transporter, DHA2 family, multidrug resistance protein